jgi:hypothetical protein
MNREPIDLYSDYLNTAFGQTSATNLTRVLNHEISHDTITRFLTNKELTSRDFWKIVKPEIRRIQKPNAMIAIDDFIVEKPHSDENGVVAWFFDHTRNEQVQGMNIVDAVYITEDARMPSRIISRFQTRVAWLARKPAFGSNLKTMKTARPCCCSWSNAPTACTFWLPRKSKPRASLRDGWL